MRTLELRLESKQDRNFASKFSIWESKVGLFASRTIEETSMMSALAKELAPVPGENGIGCRYLTLSEPMLVIIAKFIYATSSCQFEDPM